MKINDTSRLAGMQAYQNTHRAKQSNQSQAYEAESQRDGVSISQAALNMARETYGDPAARAEHLTSVKQQIENGTYHVDAGAVVRKMLEAYGGEF